MTTGRGLLQTLHHLYWTSSLIWARDQLCRTYPSAPHPSPSVKVLHRALLLPALLSYSSCLRPALQGSCWVPTRWDFVNLQLFNRKTGACQKSKSSSFLPLLEGKCKSNFVSLCGSIRDRAFHSLTSDEGNHPKAVAPKSCAERPFLPPLPQNRKFLGFCACDFNFAKSPSSLPPSVVEFCSCWFPLSWARFPGCPAH